MNKTRLSMILFIVSEGVFFMILIIAFLVYHRNKGDYAEAARHLDALKTGIFTACLFASSATVWRAGVKQREGRRKAAGAWICMTILLGAVFLAGQGLEYVHLIRENVVVSRDLFGTTFFTLTGLHGIHVFVGLVLLSLVLVMQAGWKDAVPPAAGMEGISLYWHFVDGVWAVIFPTVYIVWKLV